MDIFLYCHLGKDSQHEKCNLSRWSSFSRNYEKKHVLIHQFLFGNFLTHLFLMYPFSIHRKVV